MILNDIKSVKNKKKVLLEYVMVLINSYVLILYIMDNKKSRIDDDIKKDQPSAVEDCADVTSKHERFKKETDKSKFPPVDYEKPPHY